MGRNKETRLRKVQNLYIDMDGVMVSLSDENLKEGNYPILVPDAMGFLEWAACRFRCHFLTCWGRKAIRDCFPQFPDFPVCEWKHDKTEAIDYTRSFYWLDDDCMESEQQELKKRHVENSFFWIDSHDEEALTKFMKAYEEGFGSGIYVE